MQPSAFFQTSILAPFLSVAIALAATATAQSETKSPAVLSASAALEEVDLLDRALRRIHPGLTRYTPDAALKTAMNSLRDAVAEGIDAGELYRRVAVFLGEVRCGHTRVMPGKQLAAFCAASATLIPFTFRLFGHRSAANQLGSSSPRSAQQSSWMGSPTACAPVVWTRPTSTATFASSLRFACSHWMERTCVR